MKINGKEAMYRTFEGTFAKIACINSENEETTRVEVYVDGKAFGDADFKQLAFAQVEAPLVPFKLIDAREVKKRVAMYLDDFVRYGFEIDDKNKVI